MTDRTPATAADALLDALREVKDDFRAVDSAVATHVRGVRQRAGTNSLAARATAVAATVEGTVGFLGISVGDAAQLSFGANASCAFAIGVTSAAITWYFGPPVRGRTVKAADERCDAFLFAGVAAELALGELRTALDEGRAGLPGSAETLAERTAEAQEAFAHYAMTLQSLDENDLTVRFPWAQRDVDLDVARALLEVNAEAVLAQIGMTVPRPDTGPWRRARPRPARPQHASATAGRAGDLSTVIETAETLRGGMASAGDALTQVEEELRQAARALADPALAKVADLVAEARMRAGLVEADCLVAETAAHQAGAAESAAEGLRRIEVAPAVTVLGNAFAAYAVNLQVAAAKLAPSASTEPLRESGVAIQNLLGDIPRLRATASALIASIVTAWETLGHLSGT